MEVINIENNIKISEDLGLLQNLPYGIANKISSKIFFIQEANEVIDVIIIASKKPEILSVEIANIGGVYEDLGFGFGIVRINLHSIVNLAQISGVQYIELPKSLYTTDSNSNRAACVNRMQDTQGLYGEGVLVGFIDSGIDYTHRAFRNDDGSTRIEYIYDLSGDGQVYSREKINEALKSSNPYSIVNTPDLTKHGTHVAGIACAGGLIDKRYYGVAPKSSIIMVRATRGEYTLSTQIMRGLRFLIDKSVELNMPIVINISLSTNDGAHDGLSLLEQYISTIATLEKVTIVIASGNEGDAAHHIGDLLLNNVDSYINVGNFEDNVVINLYKTVLPEASINITNPIGETTGNIKLAQGYKTGRIGNDTYGIYISGPKPFDIIGEVTIALIPLNKYLVGGRWKITIIVDSDGQGRFDMWLPISEGLNIQTKFFNPTVTNTLGIPATVRNIISVGSYNYVSNTISPFSGRGVLTEFKAIKPDLVAPGENIYSTIPNNSFDTKSGTSMAAPHVTGICALFSEWGIKKGNDPYLYGERLKYFLVDRARRERNDVTYPDPSWGYGTICAYDSYVFLSSTINSLARYTRSDNCIVSHNKKYKEYTLGKLFIRKPL